MLPEVLFAASSAASSAPREFSEDYIEGLYDRFFEFMEWSSSTPCPVIVNHLNRGSFIALNNSRIFPHDKNIRQGARCNDGGILSLNSYGSRSHIPGDLNVNEIAEKTFTMLKQDSTSFFLMGKTRGHAVNGLFQTQQISSLYGN